MDDSIFSDNPSLVENWKGLGMVKKEHQTKPKRKVFLLSNGGRFIIDNEIVVTTNTCALDSVCQALAVSYIDRSSINKIIQESDHMLCQLIKSMCEKDNEDVYKIRTSLAKIYFKKLQKEATIEVYCECNVLYIFDKILIDCDLYSAEEKESCTELDCPINGVVRKVSVLRLHNTHVTNIQEAANTLLNSTDMTPCRRSACKGIKSFELILRNLVSFEISEECISVYETPTKLVLKYNEYELISIIEFVPPTVGTTGHYKAHCRRGNIWQCYDDISTKIMRSTNKKVIPHCIIYVRI